MNKFLFKFKIRGHWYWSHSATMSEAISDVSKQLNEDISDYGLEMCIKNLDGSDLDQYTLDKLHWS